MAEPVMRLADDGGGKSLPRRFAFTVATLEALACPANKERIIVYDAKAPGLTIRVTSNGAKTFTLYKKFQGQPVKMRFGDFPTISIEQARKLAAAANASIAQGIDPREGRRAVRQSLTLAQLWEKYQTEHAELRATDRTKATDKSRFKTCLEDWSGRKVATISADDVRNKHAAIGRARGKTTANRAVQLLRRLFNFAKLDPNPAAKGVVDFFHESSRERFMEADEIPRFFAALEAEPNEALRDYIKMSLWTGARRSNVQSMRWDEINLDTATWTVPAGKSKSREAMKIHLSAPALAVLESRKGNGSAYVFNSHGTQGHIVEPRFAWKRLLTAANIKDLRIHDLRRTLGSWQAAGGASLAIIGKSLGHHDVATTAIYARLNLDPVRASVDGAAAAILAAATPERKK
ncbi:MAG TPA: tyrosine-type recombinase/integrase [Tepidisphaeraceae bacterium]|jgi:integrase|nr:tyrosine-type recombinase/integrase [Tepidisphaeraceae bacterium]